MIWIVNEVLSLKQLERRNTQVSLSHTHTHTHTRTEWQTLTFLRRGRAPHPRIRVLVFFVFFIPFSPHKHTNWDGLLLGAMATIGAILRQWGWGRKKTREGVNQQHTFSFCLYSQPGYTHTQTLVYIQVAQWQTLVVLWMEHDGTHKHTRISK